MTTDPLGDAAVIDTMTVRWQAHGFTGIGTGDGEPGTRLIDPARLDRLTDEMLAGPLADALTTTVGGRDQLVCLRSVTVAPTTVWWDRPDADVVATWARAVADAVAEAIRRGRRSDEVVRYRSTEQAVADLVVHAAVGDVRRAWAWRQIGLWPATCPADATTADDSARIAAEVLTAHPEQTAAVLATLATSGKLAEAVARWGVDRTVTLVAAAWAAHGGDRRVVTDDHVEAPTRQATLHLRIAAAAATSISRATPAALGGIGFDSALATAAAPGRARLARALAAAAVLAAEPATVCHTAAAGAVVAALTGRYTGAGAIATERHPATAIERHQRAGTTPRPDGAPPGSAAARTLRDPRAGEPADGSRGNADDIDDSLVHTGTTAWGGLLFLLHVIGDMTEMVDTAEPTEPERVWPATRPALHRLGHTLASRALPDADPPRPDDPAVLAFAGLGPDDPPPEPAADEPPASAHARADAVVTALRTRLLGSAVDTRPEPALLAAVLRRSATITADPGWVDVELDLDQVSIAVRRAGLDLDPGWIPWLGRVVRFRYV